jgi:type II secretory pathway pseudopilin PulG
VIRRRLRDQRGEVSLIEMLVAITIFSGVLGATLFTFQTFDTLNRRTVSRSASQDAARTSIDLLARNLRNLASPTIEKPQAVDRASGYDLIFQTVDPNGPNSGANSANIKRVRWCLNRSDPTNEKLYVQQQTWVTLSTPDPPSDLNCPGSGWTTTSILVSNVTNDFGGQSRPLFAYDSATLTAVRQVHVDLYSDLDPAKAPNETHITSGVFLRNQNAAPVAAFSYAFSGNSAIVLNGSQSYDPEGGALGYSWVDGGIKQPNATGVTYTLPATPGSTHTIQLQVFDPSGLEGDSTTVSIKVPS